MFNRTMFSLSIYDDIWHYFALLFFNFSEADGNIFILRFSSSCDLLFVKHGSGVTALQSGKETNCRNQEICSESHYS